ncbi:MAG: DUF4296 domain-containing protein [Spirosomataceae bacterium]
MNSIRLFVVWMACLCLGLLACHSTNPSIMEKPDDLIPNDTMAMMLRDIHLIEARINKMNIAAQDSTKLIYQAMEKRLFLKYHTDSTRYRSSYRYYISEPERFGELYKKVVEDLEKRNQSANID